MVTIAITFAKIGRSMKNREIIQLGPVWATSCRVSAPGGGRLRLGAKPQAALPASAPGGGRAGLAAGRGTRGVGRLAGWHFLWRHRRARPGALHAVDDHAVVGRQPLLDLDQAALLRPARRDLTI